MYDYDRRAATIRPEVAYQVKGDKVIVSVLVGTLLGTYKRPVGDIPDAIEGELVSLKGQLEQLTGSDADAAWQKADNLLETEGFKSYFSFDDRDKGLAKKQWERQKAEKKVKAKVFGKWLREGVVELVEDIYRKYRSGRFSKEPCVTASYIKDLLSDIPGWYDYQEFFRDLDNRKQLAACHYALEGARKKGKLNSSTGAGITGRETRCYEPLHW